jgi:two-component system response regulator AtoC
MASSRPNAGGIAVGVRALVIGSDGAGGLFHGTEITARVLADPGEVWRAVESLAADVVVVDVRLEPSVSKLVGALRGAYPEVPVVVTALDVREEALVAVRSAVLLHYEVAEPGVGRDLLGASPVMERVREMIARAAQGNATVLVRGETGTGKELVAKAVHQASPRAAGPFVALHCAALPETLLESELFGYEKGAFTGAVSRKMGRVEAASGGTLFLDEIGEITPATQAKLLRLVQEREYQRLGGVAPLRADVRFVAATHRDLESMVKSGAFREDLFYRLNVVPLWVPPLRARGDDLEHLAAEFCRRFAEESGRRGLSLSTGAKARIRRMRWPGNVRQLQNFIERLVVMSTGSTIEEADVVQSLTEVSPFESLASEVTSISEHAKPEQVRPLEEAVRLAEREAITRALKAATGNRAQAARLLGISRASLYNKLREHDLP